jgi:hypothetical protein
MAVESAARRSVVPPAAGRTLWLAAAWTGAGAAALCAVVSIAAVAICWLPASGGSGNAGSAIRAGILTFLAALHGGITVDAVPAAFVPLGLTVVVGAVAWRAGCGLADAAAGLGEQRLARLAQAGAGQAVVFAVTCALAAHFVTLGTSSVGVASALLAGLVLFVLTGGLAFVRTSPLGAELAERTPDWARRGLRAAAAGLAMYVGAGAVLVAVSLVLHHDQATMLSRQVGGGWSGVPILLLGVLAAPNAAIAGASYLAGPGFAVGTGSGVSLGSTVHGTLPAFPVLAAVPSGPAGTAAWLLVAATPVAAGVALTRVAYAAPGWRARWQVAGGAVPVGMAGALVLAWQGGGAIGSGRLNAVGASPWQFSLAVGAGLAGVAAGSLGALAALEWWRARGGEVLAFPAAERLPAREPVPGRESSSGPGLDDRAG